MQNNNQSLLKYAGLATQFAVAIGVAIFIGIKIDEWLKLKNPICVWVLPLVIIIAIIFKIIKETSPKK